MLRQLSVQIPRAEIPAIITFLQTPVSELQKVTGYLATAQPFSDVEDLVSDCHSATGVDAEVVDAVVSVAINISRLKRDIDEPTSEVLAHVLTGFNRAIPHENSEDKNRYEVAWRERQKILEQLLDPDAALEIMSKARELLYDFQSVFLDSTVLTDVRHIYNNNASEIKGGLILYTLGLEFLEGHETHQLHLVLSSADIEKMIRQLRRAQEKAEVAEKLLSDMGLKDLTPRRNV